MDGIIATKSTNAILELFYAIIIIVVVYDVNADANAFPIILVSTNPGDSQSPLN